MKVLLLGCGLPEDAGEVECVAPVPRLIGLAALRRRNGNAGAGDCMDAVLLAPSRQAGLDGRADANIHLHKQRMPSRQGCKAWQKALPLQQGSACRCLCIAGGYSHLTCRRSRLSLGAC